MFSVQVSSPIQHWLTLNVIVLSVGEELMISRHGGLGITVPESSVTRTAVAMLSASTHSVGAGLELGAGLGFAVGVSVGEEVGESVAAS